MSIKLNEIVPEDAINSLKNLVQCLESNTDIRICLSLLSPVAYIFQGFIDIYKDADIRFVSYVIVDQFANVQGAYDGHSETWYKLNQQNIEKLRKILSIYCQKLLEAIQNNNTSKIIDASKDFFVSFHEIARQRTMDVRARRE
jgi:23S rRNA U2552 (ribose-2'-O)-methylase RlmE/FtsJ